MKLRAWVWGAGLLGCLLVVVFPWLKGDIEMRELDEAFRASLPDAQFVELEDGFTHYEWAGPEDGPKVVFVHGFSSPSFVWDKQFHAVAEAGFRVLRYDQFGRGYSDRPDTRYSDDLYDRQLLQLLDSQGVEEAVTLVGLSMGGATTIRFTDRHPERVDRFVLFAPAGFAVDLPLYAQVLRVPLLRDWLMKAVGDRIVLRGIEERVATDPAMVAAFRAEYVKQLSVKGYKRALLSTLLHNPLTNLGEDYARVGTQGKPCALFWGTADVVVPYASHEQVQAAIPHIQFVSVEGGGHTVNYEMPERVNPALIAFLEEGVTNLEIASGPSL